MLIALQDLADIVEQPLHKLGLHGASWVIAAGCLGLLLIAAITFGLRRLLR
jgi:hypothetical protein